MRHSGTPKFETKITAQRSRHRIESVREVGRILNLYRPPHLGMTPYAGLVFTSPICILLYVVSTVHLGNLLIVVASSGTLLLDGFRILKIYTVSLTVYVLIFAIQQICQLFPYSIHPQNIINKLAKSKHHPISSKQCSKPCVANYIIINQPSFISCIHLICIYPHILTLRTSITRT